MVSITFGTFESSDVDFAYGIIKRQIADLGLDGHVEVKTVGNDVEVNIDVDKDSEFDTEFFGNVVEKTLERALIYREIERMYNNPSERAQLIHELDLMNIYYTLSEEGLFVKL